MDEDNTMKAIVRDRYGSPDVLVFEDIDKPVPGPDEVLVRARASSVNTADLDYLRGFPFAARIGTGLASQATSSWDSMWRGTSKRSERMSCSCGRVTRSGPT